MDKEKTDTTLPITKIVDTTEHDDSPEKPKQVWKGAKIPELCKNLPWRPRKFENPDEFRKYVDDYFTHCENTPIKLQHLHAKGITIAETPTPPTMSGLAAWLCISRDSLNKYQRNKHTFYDGEDPETQNGISDIISQARRRIEQDNVNRGLTGVYESRLNTLNLASNFGFHQQPQDGALKPLLPSITIVLGSGSRIEIGDAQEAELIEHKPDDETD